MASLKWTCVAEVVGPWMATRALGGLALLPRVPATRPSPGEWLGWCRHRAPLGVVWVPRLSMLLCLRSTMRPGRWCFGDAGVSCHNTCATEALGALDRPQVRGLVLSQAEPEVLF